MEVNENTSTSKYISDEVTKNSKKSDEQKSDLNEHKDSSSTSTSEQKNTDKNTTSEKMTDSFDSAGHDEHDAVTNITKETQTSPLELEANVMADVPADEPVSTPPVATTTQVEAPKDPFLATLSSLCNEMYRQNKSEIATGSLKQISKLLSTIAKKPLDKKSRQIRADNIIIKKFITGVEGATNVFTHLGFQDETIDGKLYKYVPESCELIPRYNALSSYLADFKPTLTTPASTTSSEVPSVTEAKPQKPIDAPKPCITSWCGYYGTAETDHMCSTCYKTHKHSLMSKPTIRSTSALSGITSRAPATAIKSKNPRTRLRMAILKVRVMCRFKHGAKTREQQVHKDRCWSCNRKLGITGTECRCGYIFCGKHRYADEHNCTFDHYARHQAALEKANQKVKSSKMDFSDS